MVLKRSMFNVLARLQEYFHLQECWHLQSIATDKSPPQSTLRFWSWRNTMYHFRVKSYPSTLQPQTGTITQKMEMLHRNSESPAWSQPHNPTQAREVQKKIHLSSSLSLTSKLLKCSQRLFPTFNWYFNSDLHLMANIFSSVTTVLLHKLFPVQTEEQHPTAHSHYPNTLEWTKKTMSLQNSNFTQHLLKRRT